MRSIVLIHTGGIGDFLQTFPVLEGLRRKWPAAHIAILGHPERAELACLGGLADEAVDFETSGCHRLFVPDVAAADVPRLVAEANLVLNCLPHEAFQSNLVRGTPARVLPIRSFPPHGSGQAVPIARFVYDQVSAILELPATDAVPHLRLQCKAPTDDQVVAIHPGSGAAEKNWPAERFRDLAWRLSGRGMTVRWILGPAERECDPWRDEASSPECLGPCRLSELARFLASVRLYVGNDSGITHLAAAVGATTVALFGPSDAMAWGPRGEKTCIVKTVTKRMADISVDTVAAAVSTVLESAHVA